MENDYDYAVLGGGPSGLGAFERYKRHNKNASGLLIVENSSDEGSHSKGIKVVNSIVPKQPVIQSRSANQYKQIIELKNVAEILLKQYYGQHPCFFGSSSFGFRYCRNMEEYDILGSLENFYSPVDKSLTKATADFIQKQSRQSVDKNLLFPFKEQVWDINLFLAVMRAKIYGNGNFICTPEFVTYSGGKDGKVHLSLWGQDGQITKIAVNKLIVCKGIGNIEFEDDVRKVEGANTIRTMNFGILEYYKIIYKPELLLPDLITSVTIPTEGMHLTNEQDNTLSLLYNLNSGIQHSSDFNKNLLDKQKSRLSNHVFTKNPSIPNESVRDFMCYMTVDSSAYSGNIEKHYQFIISYSVNKNIRYINLPSFTVLGIALQNLPSDLNKL